MNRLEELKKKTSQIDKDLAIFNNDLKRLTDQLKKKFSINTNQAEDRLIHIDNEINHIDKKIDNLTTKAEETLKGIKK